MVLMGGTASKAMAVAKNLRDHGVSHVARAGGGGGRMGKGGGGIKH